MCLLSVLCMQFRRIGGRKIDSIKAGHLALNSQNIFQAVICFLIYDFRSTGEVVCDSPARVVFILSHAPHLQIRWVGSGVTLATCSFTVVFGQLPSYIILHLS